MSRVAISYEDCHHFQLTTKGLTKKLINIMRGRDMDEQFIDDMRIWLNNLTHLVTIVDRELQSSVINDVSLIRCIFAKLAIFGDFGEFSSHLLNIVMLIKENDIKECRKELRYLINVLEFYY